MGIVLRDALRHGLQHHGLSRFRRRHDQGAGPLPEGTEEVDDPVGVIGLAEPPEIAVEGQLFVGMDGAEVAKIGSPARFGGGAAIHLIDSLEGCRLPSAGGASGLAGELVARAQPQLTDQSRSDVEVAVFRQITELAATDETRTAISYF